MQKTCRVEELKKNTNKTNQMDTHTHVAVPHCVASGNGCHVVPPEIASAKAKNQNVAWRGFKLQLYPCIFRRGSWLRGISVTPSINSCCRLATHHSLRCLTLLPALSCRNVTGWCSLHRLCAVWAGRPAYDGQLVCWAVPTFWGPIKGALVCAKVKFLVL